MADTAPRTSIQVTGAPTLHHLEHSQSMRVLWALEELAESHNFEYNLEKYPRIKGRADPALKKIFPLGKSPVLVVPHIEGRSDSPVTLAESRIVLQFISDAYSRGEWVPSSLSDRMRDAYFQEFANNTLSSTYMLLIVFSAIPHQSPWFIRPMMNAISNGAISLIKKELDAPHQLMEDALSEEKPWFAGEKIGLADFNMSWVMDVSTQRGYLDAKRYPKVKSWTERVHARTAYQKAREKGGQYDLVRFGGGM